MDMDATGLVVLIVAIIAIGAAAIFFWQMKQRHAVKERFGPEYERAVREYGSESKAAAALGKRAQRTSKYKIRELSSRERQEFESSWRTTQARFVDDPRGAVAEADTLVNRLMQTRGYPMGDFDRQAEDISVDHPHVVQNYRAAHNIALSDASGQASTEDLRRALVCYRALFDELLEAHPAPSGREAHA